MTICLDIDGCLANFNDAAQQVHGVEAFEPTHWDWYKDLGLSEEAFWKPIHDLGPRFYGEFVQPYPWYREIIHLVSDADDFVFVTACSDSPHCYSGKFNWVRNQGLTQEVIICKSKHLLANEEHLLIDDNDDNIVKFRGANLFFESPAFLFPQPWNYMKDFSDQKIELLTRRLELWKKGKY